MYLYDTHLNWNTSNKCMNNTGQNKSTMEDKKHILVNSTSAANCWKKMHKMKPIFVELDRGCVCSGHGAREEEEARPWGFPLAAAMFPVGGESRERIRLRQSPSPGRSAPSPQLPRLLANRRTGRQGRRRRSSRCGRAIRAYFLLAVAVS